MERQSRRTQHSTEIWNVRMIGTQINIRTNIHKLTADGRQKKSGRQIRNGTCLMFAARYDGV